MSSSQITPAGQQPASGGVLGFLGTATSAKLVKGDTKIFYVEAGHANASDQNDGTDPSAPLATLQGLIARTVATNAGTGTRRPIIEDYDTIYVIGAITEAVTITDATTIGRYVNLLGIGNNYAVWQSGAGASSCLVAGGTGWFISGFRFTPPATAFAVVVPFQTAPYGASSDGSGTVIDGCFFDGAQAGVAGGVDIHGAPINVTIQNCKFTQMGGAGATAIASSNIATAEPVGIVVENNIFVDNTRHIDADLNGSVIRGNIIANGAFIATAIFVDLRGGTDGVNVIAGNHFGNADYSNVGGFYANAAAPGSWGGNYSEDIAEAEVGDNGLTILPPA